MYTPEAMKKIVIAIEKNVSEYVHNEMEAMVNSGGEKLAHELVITVAALFAARNIAYIHVITGESLESLRGRLLESYEHSVKITVNKYLENLIGAKNE